MSASADLREVALTVDGQPLALLVDDAHLRAHVDDLFVPLDVVFERVGRALGPPEEGFVQRTIRFDAPVGRTGCVPAGEEAFWGYRRGRDTPSRLVLGEKQPTDRLCAWGEWQAPGRFRLYTAYPGAPAPREIHDPDLPLAALDASIAFWSRHALVVEEGDFQLTPDGDQ